MTYVFRQTWRPGGLEEVAKKGHRALFGDCDHWYLDVGLGTFLDPNPDNPESPIKPPFHDWRPPYKNWRQVLAYDPLGESLTFDVI